MPSPVLPAGSAGAGRPARYPGEPRGPELVAASEYEQHLIVMLPADQDTADKLRQLH